MVLDSLKSRMRILSLKFEIELQIQILKFEILHRVHRRVSLLFSYSLCEADDVQFQHRSDINNFPMVNRFR